MIGIRARLRAAAVHFLATAAVAAMAAGLVFGLWFPDPFARMLGGTELFLLVLACDLVLGPVISLVIWNPRKPRAELVRDYAVVGMMQVVALVYGLHAVATVRPLFWVFVVDRYEIVSSGALTKEDLAVAAEQGLRVSMWHGPQQVFARRPKDAQEREEVLWSGLQGRDIAYLPRYYQSPEGKEGEILARAGEVADLVKRKPAAAAAVYSALQQAGKSADQVRWVMVQHPRGFWTLLMDARTARAVAWLSVDPL